MAKLRCAIAEEPARTYVTRENAVRALNVAVLALFAPSQTINYLICATEGGRFYPVVLPTENQVTFAVQLARRGFCVVRV